MTSEPAGGPLRVPYREWKRPIDDAYAFQLRPVVPAVPAEPMDIRDVAEEVLAEGHAARFAARVSRWSGPEDVVDGHQPYVGAQLRFAERPWSARLTRADLDEVLRGTVLVLRGVDRPTDYVLRDHHTLDVVLYHYRTTGELPRALFHADRHSDWCDDRFLAARVPPQAAAPRGGRSSPG